MLVRKNYYLYAENAEKQNEKEKLLAWWKEHGTCQKAEGTL